MLVVGTTFSTVKLKESFLSSLVTVMVAVPGLVPPVIYPIPSGEIAISVLLEVHAVVSVAVGASAAS